MFTKILNWVKTHKILALILVVVVFVLFSLGLRTFRFGSYRGGYYAEKAAPFGDLMYSKTTSKVGGNLGVLNSISDGANYEYDTVSAPVSQEDRKVITNSNFSLHVKNVDNAAEDIRNKTTEMGGFMVNTNIRRDAEASSSTIEVRVPSNQLVEFSKYLKTIAVKVVYENITGSDITDQYVDYEERLSSLQGVKARFEEIMEEAETVDEIMKVQNSILSIQRQIDQIKGQLTYMDRATATSKVTITLSTDELSLPYTPVKSWRPDVIMKEAIRALISIFRAIGTVGIWVVVFIPLVILLIALKIAVKYLFRKRTEKK